MSVFARIVECGSISAAADSLDLSKSVVSQHLKTLESELGVPLLKRTTRRQTLTPAGELFYTQCQQLNQLAADAWDQAQSNQSVPRGKIKITAPHALMGPLIAPVIGQLMQQYPQIEPQLIASDDQQDLMQHGIDLAIRVGHSQESSYRQRRIGAFRDVLCGSATYINSCPTSSLNYVANRWQGKQIQHQLRHKENESQRMLEFKPGCTVDSLYTTLALLEAGAGIGIVPDFILNANTSSLIEVMPDYQLSSVPIFAVHPYQSGLPVAVDVTLGAIEAALQQNQERQ
ncbi:MAG: LysR family transcriptional regulator [Oceanospirillaceae bacterium]|nr:LysR family transcriptional regulator [Oceanospirillaceae bacterium]